MICRQWVGRSCTVPLAVDLTALLVDARGETVKKARLSVLAITYYWGWCVVYDEYLFTYMYWWRMTKECVSGVIVLSL